ncbi:hypothetical protein FRC07_009729 [Ceratobasidium sp. 392]|nr:hypothetical protein FRC07_009729 [Ceratobasidium sp. 392]
MTSQLSGSQLQDKAKHIIEAIRLEPTTSKYAIDLKILVDGKELLRLPEIKPGQQLRWNDVIECYILPSSRINVRIYEIHTFKRLRIGTIEYAVSNVASRSEALLESDSGKYIATIMFLQSGLRMESVARFLAQAEGSERHKRMISDLGSARDAIKAILTIGGLVAEFMPVTEAAFAICNKAWRKLEEQEQCDANVERLMHGLVDIVPFVELVEKAVQLPQLRSTTEALISFINDASRFIVEYNGDGSVAQRAVLKELKPLGQALYDPNRGCLEGTRTDIIGEVINWAQISNAPDRLFWLYGQAGLGKSAIATSLCQEFENLKVLAASFFCKRDDPERRNPQRVLTTIIHGLAVHHTLYTKAVIAAIQEDSSICTAPMQTQYDKLFKEPLRNPALLNSSVICVVVVDALDECGTEESRRQLLGLICLMTQLARWLRVIVTSRPDMEIKDFFSQSDHTSFLSRNIYHYNASNDIGTFISKRLSSSPRARGLPNNAVSLLTARAVGLFIWAQTACEFILSSLDPNTRLDLVLQEAPLKHSTSAIDKLYTVAIEASLGECGEDNAEIIQQCLGAIIVCSTRMPLPVDALSKLLGHRISDYVLQSVVDSLGSVLYTDDKQGGAVRVYHPSFADYVTTSERSARFCVDTGYWNTELAESCIEAMTAELKFNICGLETSYKRNRDVQGLDKRVDEAISQRLRYSCVYWTSHLIDAKKDSIEAIESGLSDLVSGPGILFWMEVLSLIGKLDSALPSIRNLMSFSQGTHLYDYASDLERFLQTFYDPISQSTPHLYLSALAFLPVQTTTEQLRQECFPNTIRIRAGAEKVWSAWLLCVSDDENGVRAVAVSPDGHRIASVLMDDTLRVWDAETGVPLDDPIVKHSHSGNSVVFSPGGRGIFTGLRNRGVRVWSGDPSGPNEDDTFLGHAEPIACVAYSPDGSLIATGSYDKSLRLWHADSLTAVGESFVGHSADVRCIAFSHDSRHIISGSSDKTLRLWDTNTSTTISGPFIGHLDVITCVAFSADDCRVASGSADKTVRVWNAATSALVVEPLVRHAGWIQSVAFHPSGNRLVSGSIDNTICLWDLDTGDIIGAPLVGHSGSVNSVVFSPDGRHVVSGSADRTVRVWDADIAPLIGRSLVGHADRVIYVTFLSDGRSIISGSPDTTVHAWDIETGVPVGTTLVKDSSEAQSLALSPDGCYVVSGSPDRAVRLWDTKTGLLRLELQLATRIEGTQTTSSASHSLRTAAL